MSVAGVYVLFNGKVKYKVNSSRQKIFTQSYFFAFNLRDKTLKNETGLVIMYSIPLYALLYRKLCTTKNI